MLEDSAADAALILRELTQAGFQLDHALVDTERDYLAVLSPSFDVILADYNIGSYSAPAALAALRARQIDVPFIVVSGSIGEEAAIELLSSGAADYLLKDRLTRLSQAIVRAIDERRLRKAKREAERALVLAEERMRFAVEASRVGIWEADLRTGVVTWSEMLEHMHGLPTGGFAGTTQAFMDLVEPADRGEIERVVRVAASQQSDASVIYRTRWPDGSMHWIAASGRPTRDENGLPVRAAGIAQDVTERVRLEDQYRQAQKMEAIGQLAGGIAHDFNNLLTAIDGYCMLMAESMDADSPHQAHLAEVRRAADRATGLTRQLLAFSRRQILETRVLDLRESLKSLVPMLKRLIGENVEVIVRESHHPGRIKADPGQIEQVILNLAINARDAMPTGGRLTLHLSSDVLRVADARSGAAIVPGRYALLEVSDSGHGMDAAVQARIFEPFFTTKQKGKGTGLGLSTVYGIVKQSGGYIWVDSEPGRGTSFKIFLPHVDEAVERPTARPAAGSLDGTETILVVEDEESVRQLVRKVLERYGYTVLAAGTPSAAIELLERTPDDIRLLVTDVILPQMSGRDLADRILASHPKLRVLFMSGYTDDAIVHHGVLNEGTPFIQKPFTPPALARKVRELLD